jgi:hypothetical protein
MATRVTLRMFSGRPNPVFALSPADERKLYAQVAVLRSVPAATPMYRTGGLGYRGFDIEPVSVPPGITPRVLPARARLYGEVLDYGGAAHALLDVGRAIERWLVTLALPLLDPPARLLLRQEAQTIYADPDCRSSNVPNAAPPLPGRLAYSAARWNGLAAVALNNCYNYATNRKFTASGPAVPGSGGGVPAPFGNCPGLRAAVKADGLRHETRLATGGLPKGGWLVALFIRGNGIDHHFYRQDRTGKWSHKPGAWPTRKCDESGNAIVDPRNADTLDYTFCGFFESHSGVTIAP